MKAQHWRKAVDILVETLQHDAPYLDELDAATGDGEHGTTMQRAFEAARQSVVESSGTLETEADVLEHLGKALSKAAGGAAGALYSTFFTSMGQAAATLGQDADSAMQFVSLLDAGVTAVCRLGKAQVGDKTMVDTLVPALEAARQAASRGDSLYDALHAAVNAGHVGMLKTREMVARKGRASYLGERSVGHQDPGATSAHLILKSMALGMEGKPGLAP
jgi:dihydroxyacetone kinase-like protein